VDWDADDDFTMLSDDGTVVGQGELDDDGLELELLSGYTGFVRFEAGGETVEGMVNTDGTITLVNASGFVELDDDLSAKGYSLVIRLMDTVNAPAGIVVSPTDPNRDDDGTNDDGNRDDDDDNSSITGGSDDTDRDDGSSGNTDTSTNDDDNDDDNSDDGDDD
jgi:hypothetical protein